MGPKIEPESGAKLKSPNSVCGVYVLFTSIDVYKPPEALTILKLVIHGAVSSVTSNCLEVRFARSSISAKYVQM